MNVLVDTSVWSLALRRRRSELASDGKALTRELAFLNMVRRPRRTIPLA